MNGKGSGKNYKKGKLSGKKPDRAARLATLALLQKISVDKNLFARKPPGRSHFREGTAIFHGFQSPVDKFIYTKICVDKCLIYTTGQGVDVPAARSVSFKRRADFKSGF